MSYWPMPSTKAFFNLHQSHLENDLLVDMAWYHCNCNSSDIITYNQIQRLDLRGSGAYPVD